MSKTGKNQKSITSFFKNPPATREKSPEKVVVKKEVEEPVVVKKVASAAPVRSIPSPKKPTVIVQPTVAVVQRRTATHETQWINLSDKFLLKNRQFDVQYAHIYAERLGSMRKFVSAAAENRWQNDSNLRILKMNDLKTDEECVLIGILFKQMILKPSIVKQLASENGFNLQPPRTRYVDPTDKLILEEESQRITLDGNIDVNKFVTGVVVAVRGAENEKGAFVVKEYCCKELSIPPKISPLKEEKYVLLCSGFLLCETSTIFSNLENFVKSLTAPTEISSEKLREIFSNTIRVVVAGNLIDNSNRLKETTNQAKYLTRKLAASSVEAMHSIDQLFDKISSVTDIDIMPGTNDPSCHMMPQQPLHPCMFPLSSKRSTTHCLTNPYDFQIGDIRFLGTSGQNIDDIDLQSTFDDRLDILENCLKWGVIAPTCPDTLSCYPYVMDDPLIITETPHVFFAGNQKKFSTRLFQAENGTETRLITVPQFAQSLSCVALNLSTLECVEISFENDSAEILS